MISNNVTRFLTSKNVKHRVFELPDEKRSAVMTAEMLGIPPGQVYKTIVLTQEQHGKPILAVVPASEEVNPKLVASVLGLKKVKVASQKEAELITGLKVGGISPIALIHRGFIILIDESINQFEDINISGGLRTLNIRLSSKDLIELTHAQVARISVYPNK